jgi:hypothetical protein
LPVPAEPVKRAGPPNGLDQLALRGVQKHGPALERVLQRLAQLVEVGHDPEPALGVGVLERVLVGGPGLSDPWRGSNC